MNHALIVTLHQTQKRVRFIRGPRFIPSMPIPLSWTEWQIFKTYVESYVIVTTWPGSRTIGKVLMQKFCRWTRSKWANQPNAWRWPHSCSWTKPVYLAFRPTFRCDSILEVHSKTLFESTCLFTAGNLHIHTRKKSTSL